jgi:LysM repeat protein
MSRAFALPLAFFLIAAAEAAPLPHASGAPAGPGPGCGGGFTAARGDTLYSIARRCETSVAELVQENDLGRPPQLATGQRLDIPGFSRMGALTPPDIETPVPMRARPDRAEESRDGRWVRARQRVPVRRAERDVYYFQTGDTLFSLARWAGTSLPALRAANPELDPREIDPGMAILLPDGAVRPEPLRARERARGPAVTRPAVDLRAMPLRRPALRDDDMEGKPEADDDDEVTPGGMDDGGPEPDGMF